MLGAIQQFEQFVASRKHHMLCADLNRAIFAFGARPTLSTAAAPTAG